MIAAASVVVAGVRWLGSDTAHRAIAPVVPPPAPAPTPLAVVIAYPGIERWMGNDTYLQPHLPSGASRTVDDSHRVDAIYVVRRYSHGAHAELVVALDELAHALPAASRVAVLAFDKVDVNVMSELAPASSLDGSRVVGPQERYRGRIGPAFLDEVLDRAALLVRGVPAMRPVVLLIADTCRTAKPDGFVSARKRLASAGIEVHVIHLDVYAVFDGGENCPPALRKLDPALVQPSHRADLPEVMRSALGL
jgi:hypothetical protein